MTGKSTGCEGKQFRSMCGEKKKKPSQKLLSQMQIEAIEEYKVRNLNDQEHGDKKNMNKIDG